jgi:RNA polymerase sigma-70 factor (ECF subfamily)
VIDSTTKAMNFEEAVMPHIDAAYNLARWLMRNDADAQDMVQEAYLRALKFFGGFRGTDARPWLLTIVRNTCYTWLRRNRSPELSCGFDEVVLARESEERDPETEQLMKAQAQLVNNAIEKLPIEFREVVVLRELEELSYKEIALVLDVPIGTVMSRLARARKRLVLLLQGATDYTINKSDFRSVSSMTGITGPLRQYIQQKGA